MKKKLVLPGLYLLLTLAVCLLAWEPLARAAADPEALRDWVASHPLQSRLTMVGLMALQVIVAFLPGEPLEIAAGYAFGAWEGLALCLLGATLGCTVTVLLTRQYGRRTVEAFFPAEKIDSVPLLRQPHRLTLLLFLLYLIPGSPKDLFNYAVGLTRLPMPRVLAVTAVARIPSVLTSTLSGDSLGLQDWKLAGLLLLLTLALSATGLLLYRVLCRRSSNEGVHEKP